MLKVYISEVEVQAVRVEGDLHTFCDHLKTLDFMGEEIHPMWKMPGGYHYNKMPNAVMFKDMDKGWVEADIGDYIMRTPIGPRLIPGDIFDMLFKLNN